MKQLDAILDFCKAVVRRLMTRIAQAINAMSHGKISPNMITLTGLVAHVYIAYLIATFHPIRAAILLLCFGLFDALDGALARLQKKDGSQGMLLDSITDRMKEIILYIGIGYALIGNQHYHGAIWAIAACGTSLLVSYVNAWGDAVLGGKKLNNHSANASFRSGLMRFEIRIVTLLVGLLSGYLLESVAVVAMLSLVTALSRLQEAFVKAKHV